MLPSFISTLMTSAALTDIFWARAATVIVSGTMTSRTMGSVGALNACSTTDGFGFMLGPRVPFERANPADRENHPHES